MKGLKQIISIVLTLVMVMSVVTMPALAEETVEKVVSAIEDLSKSLKIPQTLREVGIPKEMIPQLAAQAINDVCTPGNPREVTVDDIISIYESAY